MDCRHTLLGFCLWSFNQSTIFAQLLVALCSSGQASLGSAIHEPVASNCVLNGRRSVAGLQILLQSLYGKLCSLGLMALTFGSWKVQADLFAALMANRNVQINGSMSAANEWAHVSSR